MASLEGEIQRAKAAAGRAAADLIQTDSLIGIGTGSTVFYFINALAERCKEGLRIQTVSTSERSLNQAKSLGIPVIDIDTVLSLDLAVDGADEIDSFKRMIKGGGGALLREKIVASMSKELVVIIDDRKRVEKLGGVPLPIEIIRFAHLSTIHKLEKFGYFGAIRLESNGKPIITENGNYLFDAQLPENFDNPIKEERNIRSVPGVVETGLFIGLAGRVITGFSDGSFEIW